MTAYARDVEAGRIVAGPHVRDACRRHLRDLVDGPKRGLAWDPAAAARVIAWFAKYLRLGGGEAEGKPFVLLPWQAFVVGSIFGWKWAKTGFRRFRTAYCEEGKGSGKSPMAAGIGLRLLMADGEDRAEVYAAATMKDQAKILFRDALTFFDQSPELQERLLPSGTGDNRYNLAYMNTASFFRIIASDNRGKSGPRPHGALIDELHEHRDDSMIRFMQAGFKWRRQPLMFIITNSGVDRQSVCWEYHQYAVEVASGVKENDTFFSYVCALDDGDDPFEDEDCWIKANPSLPHLPGYEYLRNEVHQARGMPGAESICRRLNFCQWVDARNPWIAQRVWQAHEAEFDVEDFAGRRAYGAIDLSGVRDLTALGLVLPDGDGTADALAEFWTPADTLRERARHDQVPYDVWARDGWLRTTPGRSIDYAFVAQRIGELKALLDLRAIAFDAYKIMYLERELDALGIEVRLVPHPQGFMRAAQSDLWMPRSIELLEQAVHDGRRRIQANPVLRWNAFSAVTETDAKANRIFTKRKAYGRIDGVVALAMAEGLMEMMTAEKPTRSVYEDRGILAL